MVRRSAGFVSKRPHTKSRGRCLTCKRKKVKCDENQPSCGYCALRNLLCVYPQSRSTTSSSAPDSSVTATENKVNLNSISEEIPSWIVPAVNTSSGLLSPYEVQLLRHYQTSTFRTLSARNDEVVHGIYSTLVPEMCLSTDYLLYAVLSVAAGHQNYLQPSKEAKNMNLWYQQKTFATYNAALQKITSEKYETLLITSLFLSGMVPPPAPSSGNETILGWINTYVSMLSGVRILAGLKWSSGIEKLTIFPIIRRELRTLPPPPPVVESSLDPRYCTYLGPLGTTPEHPNPPPTYQAMQTPSIRVKQVSNSPSKSREPSKSPSISPAVAASPKKPASWQMPSPPFLPPPLMDMLRNLIDPPDTGAIELHRSVLVPVLHALSPIFLSLYYYHLNEDFYVRILVFPTFIMPDFHALIRGQEPRALAIMAWWFAFAQLVPNAWWTNWEDSRVMQVIGDEVMGCGDEAAQGAVAAAASMINMVKVKGKEEGVKTIFDEWEGVNWDDGPQREEEWRFEELVDMDTVG